jgi:hypothetical protein
MDEIRLIAAVLASGILTKGNLSNTEADAQYAVVLYRAIERQLRQESSTAEPSAKS